MKKIVTYLFRIITFVMIFMFIGNIAYASHNSDKREFFNDHSEVLKNIKEYSRCENRTGDIGKDYSQEIIHNNKTQIAMCENIIKHSYNIEARNLAKEIIRNAMDRNTELNDLLEKIKNNNENDEEFYGEIKTYYNKLILEIGCMKNYKEIEKIFLNSCVKVNRFSIKLSKCVVNYTKDNNVIECANKIEKNIIEENKKIEKLYKKIK